MVYTIVQTSVGSDSLGLAETRVAKSWLRVITVILERRKPFSYAR
jgi:hypothetical protein